MVKETCSQRYGERDLPQGKRGLVLWQKRPIPGQKRPGPMAEEIYPWSYGQKRPATRQKRASLWQKRPITRPKNPSRLKTIGIPDVLSCGKRDLSQGKRGLVLRQKQLNTPYALHPISIPHALGCGGYGARTAREWLAVQVVEHLRSYHLLERLDGVVPGEESLD